MINFGIWIWEQIVYPAFSFLSNVGIWLWKQIIEPSWLFLKNVGHWVWNLIKSPWEYLAGKIRGLWSLLKSAVQSLIPRFSSSRSSRSRNDFISRPGQADVNFSPQDTIIGVKDPSKLFGGGSSVNITINNPTIRNDNDLNILANKVSAVLQRQMTGRIQSQ